MNNLRKITIKPLSFVIIACFALFGTTLFHSCDEDEFLDVQPKGALAGEALQTESGVEGLVVSAYAGLLQHFQDQQGMGLSFQYAATNWTYSDVRCDDIYKGGDGPGDQEELHNLEVNVISPNNSYLNKEWRAEYIAIKRTNVALQALKETPEEEFDKKEQRIGEMLVLRSHFYFDLIRIFKRVPYIDETLPSDQYSEISNMEYTQEELWDLVESDLQDALGKLSPSVKDDGRVNKYVAHAYLAKLYLYTGEYEKAEQQAEQIISSGEYSLYPDLQDMWEAENDHSGQYLFAMETSINDGTTNGHINWSNLLNTPRGPAYNGDHFARPTQNLVNAFRTDSLGLPLLDSYNEENFDEEDDYADPRLDHFIGRLGVPWKNWSSEVYRDTSQWVYNESWLRNSVDYGTYSIKKLIVSRESEYMVSGWPGGGNAANFPLVRYAEVLLWKAEALIEQNKNLDDARTLINRVRLRAKNSPWVKTADGSEYAANYNIEPYPSDGWNQEYARKALRHERRIELCMEGHRFFDLVRWGEAESVLNQYFDSEPRLSGVAGYMEGVTFVGDKHEYLPIPQPQIDVSEGLYKQIEEYK